MRICDLGPGMIYRFVVVSDRIEHITVVSVSLWAEKTGVHCSVLPGCAYFETHQDAMVFLLAFSR